jgi:hypothetical protein
MITLTKTPDPANAYEVATITMALGDDLDLDTLAEEVANFLYACGFRFKGLVVERYGSGD